MPPMRSQWKNIGHRDEKQIPPDEEVIISFMVVATIGVSYRPVGWKKLQIWRSLRLKWIC
jgi:hypothetical protein